jgi:hypothetical protein
MIVGLAPDPRLNGRAPFAAALDPGRRALYWDVVVSGNSEPIAR